MNRKFILSESFASDGMRFLSLLLYWNYQEKITFGHTIASERTRFKVKDTGVKIPLIQRVCWTHGREKGVVAPICGIDG